MRGVYMISCYTPNIHSKCSWGWGFWLVLILTVGHTRSSIFQDIQVCPDSYITSTTLYFVDCAFLNYSLCWLPDLSHTKYPLAAELIFGRVLNLLFPITSQSFPWLLSAYFQNFQGQWYTRGRNFRPKTNIFSFRPSVSAAEYKGWKWPNVKLQNFF